MSYYNDLRDYIATLENKGKLQRIKSEVIKETEIGPLFWLQFRGLPEEEWKSFLFEQVVDVKGRKCGSVLMGPYSFSREVVALGMKCKPEEINEKWGFACSNPIEPEIIPEAPVQEVVIKGGELDKSGLEQLPTIVEEPGFSGLPRTTTEFISKDPETGIRNVGCYSGHISGNRNIIWGIGASHHGFIHWRKCREKGRPLQVAIVIGSTPKAILKPGLKFQY